MAELWTFVFVVNKGRAFTVPPVVVTSEEAGGAAEAALGAIELPLDPVTGGAANMNADGGKPPTVSASAAFNA
jgi:hypothetical protein